MSISLGRYFRLLMKYLRPQSKRVTLLALLILSGIALQLLNPQILRYFIDQVVAGSTTEPLIVVALIFLGTGLLTQVVQTTATNFGARVGWSATNMLRVELVRHCLGQDMSFHNDRTPGELIERIDGDVTALANFFSQFLVRIVGAMLLIVGVIVLLFVEDLRVGGAELIYAIIAIAVLNRMKNIAVAATAREREASAGLYGFIEERLSGIDDIRANGGGAYTMRRFHIVLREMFHHGHRAWMRRSTLWVAIISLFTIGDVIALGMGIWLFNMDAITLGTVYLFFQYTQMMWGVVEQITHQMQDLQKAGASISRVEELLTIHPSLVDGSHATHIPAGALSVTFDAVTFAYGGREPVLKEVSFTLEPGRILGLLGRTGSGKSTITRLLFRLYDPSAGSVRLGGVDLREATLKGLRNRVAMVTQDVQLFHATVRDNLTFFDRSIPDARIHDVVKELGLADWFASMPEGLDTMLAAGGGGLSAGEAQLVAFTRVFLRDPGLVILDEPSSRMDLATENLLEHSMQRLLAGRTAIIIAHRLSTVRRSDEVMILEHGVVVEHGDRAKLAAEVGTRFNQLLSPVAM